MSSKRRKAQDFIKQSHDQFLNESAKFQSNNSKINTNKFIHPANLHQKQFVKSMKNNILTVASGSPGTGKTLLALFTGIQLLNNPDSFIQKIIYVRGHNKEIEGKDLGAIPGDVKEKMRVQAYPILDNLETFMLPETIDYTLEKGRIEVLPCMYMRGRSFHNTFIIVDECQSISKHQLKTLLTRISETSKIILLGDPHQCDIDPLKNGLIDLEWRLNKQIEYLKTNNKYLEVQFDLIKFTSEDILRSELTKFAIDLYNL